MLYFGADTKNQRTKDSINVINYIYKNFEYIDTYEYVSNAFKQYKNYYENNVNLHKTITKPKIKISELDNYKFPLKPDSVQSLNIKFYTLDTLSSSIKPGNKIGSISVYYEDKILYSVDILLENELIHNSPIYYFWKILTESKYAFNIN